jgi:RNA-directed DNA polymerase
MQTYEAEACERMAGTAGGRRNLPIAATGAEVCTATGGRTKSETSRLMESVVEKANLWRAYRRVVDNKGAPGADGLAVSEFNPGCKSTGHGS